MPIDGKHYVDEVVRVTDLFTVEERLEGFTFTNCLIVGPAILLFETNCTLSNSLFQGVKEHLIWPTPVEDGMFGINGALLFDQTTFDGCRFQRIGFAGNLEFRKMFLASVDS